MTATEEQTTTRGSDQTVEEIAAILGEVKRVPLGQIKQIVEILGLEKTRELVAQTEAIQTEGGLKTADGSRARSKGGVFFYLVRGILTPPDRRRVWPPRRTGTKGKQGNVRSLAWADRLPILAKLQKRPPGEARTVKMTVIGRPGRVITKGEVMLISIPRPASVPRSLKNCRRRQMRRCRTSFTRPSSNGKKWKRP
jgi:hypothetical protein